MTGFAQTDSTGKPAPDTIKIGGMMIIREKGSKSAHDNDDESNNRGPSFRSRRSNIRYNTSTNYLVIDLGFSNFVENTTYGAGTPADAFAPGSTEDWFKLRGGKSRNVNIWFVMQRLNVIKHVVNLKYGVGLELNNYYFDDTRVKFEKKPAHIVLDPELEDAKKNKLAADYLTVPVMLNFDFTPNRHRSFGFSAGVSAGFLYSSRQKTKMDGDIDKTKGELGLERWKLSYVAELLLGRVKLYGSYAFKNMWEKGLNQKPYNVGFRISVQ
jgi:hypothetical protein